MKKLVLLLLPIAAYASPESHELEKEAARIVRDWIYEHETTERFCTSHPTEIFPFSYRGHEIMVNCEVRNAWMALPKEKR